MKKAIVVGANGYIGFSCVLKLLEKNIEVLAISRLEDDVFFSKLTNQHKNIFHICLDLSNISELSNKIKEKKIDLGNECVFYYFAWSGMKKLMDGTIENQLLNVTYLSKSIIIASEIGCCKFIDSGSMEESFAETYLKYSWNKFRYETDNANYAVSKIAAKNMAAILGYLHNIDYVHTRISAVVDKKLEGQGFITNVLRKILKNEDYEKPKNKNLFDIIDIDDLSNAYYLLGLYGKNKGDYFIGSGSPQKLDDYFAFFYEWNNTGELQKRKVYDEIEIFNPDLLKLDTGLIIINFFEKFCIKI